MQWEDVKSDYENKSSLAFYIGKWDRSSSLLLLLLLWSIHSSTHPPPIHSNGTIPLLFLVWVFACLLACYIVSMALWLTMHYRHLRIVVFIFCCCCCVSVLMVIKLLIVSNWNTFFVLTTMKLLCLVACLCHLGVSFFNVVSRHALLEILCRVFLIGLSLERLFAIENLLVNLIKLCNLLWFLRVIEYFVCLIASCFILYISLQNSEWENVQRLSMIT